MLERFKEEKSTVVIGPFTIFLLWCNISVRILILYWEKLFFCLGATIPWLNNHVDWNSR